MIDTKALREKILDLAMRGKLVPQDPNDEPANELLKRIKAEKEELIKQKKIKSDKNEIEMFRGDDGLHYEKFADGTVKEIEVPYELPIGWEWTYLRTISTKIHYGYTASAQDSGNFKLLRITDIQDNKVNWETVPYCDITPNKLNGMQLINGDIVIARTGGTIGKSFHIINLEDVAVFASYLIRVQPVDLNNSFFNKRFLESPEYWRQLDKISGGTGQPNVNAANLGTLLVPLPPEKEQFRILQKISGLLDYIDTIENAQNELNALAIELMKKVLDVAMQGKLVPQDPNDEPASSLLEKIRAEKQRLFDEGKLKSKNFDEIEIVKGDDNAYYEKDEHGNIKSIETRLYDLPKLWVWSTTNVVLDVRDGTHDTPKYVESGIPFVTSKNLKNGIIDYSDIKYISQADADKFNERSKVENDDVLMAMIGTIGNATLIQNLEQEISVKNVAIFKPIDKGSLTMNFVKLYLDTVEQKLKDTASGGNQPFLSLKKLKSIYIPIPPINEQKKISSAIEQVNQLLRQFN